MSTERVKIQGPGGRVSWVSRKAAERGNINKIGFTVAEELKVDVPDLTGKKRGRPSNSERHAD